MAAAPPGAMRSSSSALPLIAAATPTRARAAPGRRPPATPPEACQAIAGWRRTRLDVQIEIGSPQRAIALDVGAQHVAQPRVREDRQQPATATTRVSTARQPRVRSRGTPLVVDAAHRWPGRRVRRRTAAASRARSIGLAHGGAADHHAGDARRRAGRVDIGARAHAAADLDVVRRDCAARCGGSRRGWPACRRGPIQVDQVQPAGAGVGDSGAAVRADRSS